MGAAPSASLWLWAPLGADFAHLACLLACFGGLVGAALRRLCGYGPFAKLILLILFVVRLFGVLVGAAPSALLCALGPSVAAGPSWD